MGMNTVLEVEQALRQLPPEDRWEVARWLLNDLQDHTASHATAKSSESVFGKCDIHIDASRLTMRRIMQIRSMASL